MSEDLQVSPNQGQNPRRLLFTLWVAMLILNGTYLRVRPSTSLEADWLVWLRLLVGGLGIVVGFFSILKHRQVGWGGAGLIAFSVIAGLSSLLSEYPWVVLGYWVLLAGATFVTISLIRRSMNLADLERIEHVWLVTVACMLIKDFITFRFFMPPQEEFSGTFRLGLGFLHPNLIGNVAVPAIWLTWFWVKKRWRRRGLILFFLLLIYLSRARSAMLGLFLGVALCVWYYHEHSPSRRGIIKLLVPTAVIAFVLGFAVLTVFEAPGASGFLSFINRGQTPEEVTQLTGRTQLWPIVYRRIVDENPSMFFGHGYGASRFVINVRGDSPPFYADHAHNALLEATLSTGIIGVLILAFLMVFGLQWLFRFGRLKRFFSDGFVVRAACIMVAVQVTALTEPYICVRINPLSILFIFYLAVLDEPRFFEAVSGAQAQAGEEASSGGTGERVLAAPLQAR